MNSLWHYQIRFRFAIAFTFSFLFISIPLSHSQNSELSEIQKKLIITKNDTARAKLLNDAAFLLRTSDPKLSLQYSKLSMELSLNSGYKSGVMNSFLVRGIIYKRIGDYETAMQNYMYALDISESVGDTTRISSCYNNIGSIYQAQKNYSLAIEYFRKSLRIEKLLGKKEQVSIRLYNIGTVYEAMEKLDSAYYYYNLSLIIEQELQNDEGISFALYGLGGILTKKEEYQNAEEYLKQAFDLAKKNEDLSAMSYCNNELGLLYMKWKKFDLAIEYFLQSITLADSIEEKSQIKESYHNLALTYAEVGQLKKSIEYFLKYDTLNDEINNSEISRKIAEINTKYEVDKAEKEIELVKKENKIKELELSQQISLRNFLFFTSIIVIILGIFRFGRKKKVNDNRIHELSVADKTLFFEKILLSKVAWAIMLSIYIVIYAAIMKPFGLSLLLWADKWSVIAVYGALTFAVIMLSFFIYSPLKKHLGKSPFIIKYIGFALINILLLSLAIQVYNSVQGLSSFTSHSFVNETLLQISIISLLPVLLLLIFSERISYAENLKDLPLEAISIQKIQSTEPVENQKNNLITIKTDNVAENIQLAKNQIICFEANDNYTAFYYLLNNKIKKELYRITLKKLEIQLSEHKEIIRCHKSYIINIIHLYKISGNAQGFRMHLKDLDFDVPVSRSFPRHILDSLKETIQ